MVSESKADGADAFESALVDQEGVADIPRLWRYALTIEINWGSVKASRFATMRLVMRGAGRDVKSKAERKEAEVLIAGSVFSSFIRLLSDGSVTVEDGLFLLSAAKDLRFFSSAAALSILTPC